MPTSVLSHWVTTALKFFAKFAIASMAVASFPDPADASVYALSYTGTVNSTFSYTGVPIPSDIAVGSKVFGSFSFDTTDAGSPTYIYGSCSGWCGGDSVTSLFAFSSNLIETVTIGSHTWTANLGQVYLVDDSMIPGNHFQTVGVDSSLDGRYALLSVYFSRTVDAVGLFTDVNSLQGITLQNATGGYGDVYTGSDAYYIGYQADPLINVVSEPPILVLFGAFFIGLVVSNHSERARIRWKEQPILV